MARGTQASRLWALAVEKSVLGVLLAGGLSTRMGRNKAELLVQGRSMLARAWELLTSMFATCVVSTHPPLTYPGYPLLPDTGPRIGPLGALCTALDRASECGAKSVFLLACDMPNITPSLITRLLKAHATRPTSALLTCFCAEESGREEPLCACYALGTRLFCEHARANARTSLNKVLPRARKQLLPYGPELAPYFRNVNTAEDLALLATSAPLCLSVKNRSKEES